MTAEAQLVPEEEEDSRLRYLSLVEAGMWEDLNPMWSASGAIGDQQGTTEDPVRVGVFEPFLCTLSEVLYPLKAVNRANTSSLN